MKLNFLVKTKFFLFVVFLISSCAGEKHAHNHNLKDIYEVFFHFDSEEIIQESEDVLVEMLSHMLHKNHSNVIIEGHSDKIGSQNYNLELSDRRARVIKAFLTRNGISSDRILIVNYGEEEAENHNHYLSRKVVFRDISAKK